MGLVARKVSSSGATADGARRLLPHGPCATVADDDPAVAGLLLGLECVGRGAVVLDRDAGLVGCNACGEALLRRLAVVRGGRLRGRTPLVAQKIDRVIHQAIADGSEAVAALVGSDALTVVLRAIPLAPGPHRFRRARVLLVLAQTGLELLPSVGFVREAFGLTATEAEVALALAGGASASAIARERAVSHETVRSHLKTIYAKTGTKRQASLVASIVHLRDVTSG